jgi:hypothetical protein
MPSLSQLASYIALGFVGLLGATILGLIWMGRIDISRLISEPNGDASLSRLQFLIFTFVIAVSFFLVVASPAQPAFPLDIPQGVFMLLGISGSSYLVSKSIQFSSDEGVAERPVAVTITNGNKTTRVKGAPIQFEASVTRATNKSVTWSLNANAKGKIDANTGEYTPPSDEASAPAVDVVRAISAADPQAFATVEVEIQKAAGAVV